MIINNQCKHVIDLTIITNLSGQDIELKCVYHQQRQHSWGNSSGYGTHSPLFSILLLKVFSVRFLLEPEQGLL